MRFSKNQIAHLSNACFRRLVDLKMIRPLMEPRKVVELLDAVITENFLQEDRLNQEVREMMKNYSDQIDKGEADYNRLFQMIKQKLAKERGIDL